VETDFAVIRTWSTAELADWMHPARTVIDEQEVRMGSQDLFLVFLLDQVSAEFDNRPLPVRRP
jgi:hypothetical protein